VATQAEVDLVINASGALPQVTRDLNRIVTTAENGAPDIDLNAALDTQRSLAAVRADLDRVVASADANASDIDLNAVLNQTRTLSDLDEQLASVIAAAQRGAAQDPVQLRAVLDGPRSLVAVRGELDRVITTAQRTAPPLVVRGEIDWDADRLRGAGRSLGDFDGQLRQLTSTAGRVLGPLAAVGGGIAGVGAAAGAGVPLVAGLVTGLESILPAAAVATQGMLAMQLVSGTLKLGMLGLEDAIKNAFDPDVKPEDLAKSLDALAPSARKFVLELADMKSEFKELQLGVQDRLFKGLDGSLRTLARSALPQVGEALNSTATTLNKMARGAVDAAAELASNGTLGKALDGATKGLENLVELPAQATTAFGQLAAAAAPAFDRITLAIADVATEASEGLTRAFESGQLEKAIDDAVDTIAQLGRIAGNVFGTIGNILGAASVEGEGLFSTLEKVTQALQDVTGSEEFKSIMQELVLTMGALADQVGPLFVQALGTISGAIEELAPVARDLIDTLGPVFLDIMESAEEPILALSDTFGKLVEALFPVIELVGGVLAEALPALTPMFETLGRIIEEMTPFIQQLAENIGSQLTPILERLPGILEQILPVFERAAEEIFPALTKVLQDMAPYLSDLAVQLADLAVELAPVIADFLEFSTMILSEVIPVVGPLLSGVIVGLITGLSGLAAFLESVVLPAFRTVGNLLTGDFSGALKSSGVDIQNLKETGSRAFNALAGDALRAMSRLASDVGNYAQQAGQRLREGVQNGINNVKTLLNSLPGIARAAVGNLAGALFSAGASLIQGLINGISSKIGQVQSKLSELTNLIPDWKGPMDVDKKLLTPSGEAIMDGLMAGFDSRLPEIRAQLGAITATIPQSVGVPRASMSPQIQVSIGGEAVDQYVTYRVRQENIHDARVLAQGVRR
jgi:phage-related protein